MARKKIALVGKGICFDTGGYNIKPGTSMMGMHQEPDAFLAWAEAQRASGERVAASQ